MHTADIKLLAFVLPGHVWRVYIEMDGYLSSVCAVSTYSVCLILFFAVNNKSIWAREQLK